MRTVDVKTALMVLGRLTGDPEDKKLLAQFVAETTIATAPKDNTGLPCEYCAEPQRRIAIEYVRQDSNLTQFPDWSSPMDPGRISIRIASIENERGALNISKLIAQFASRGA